MKKKKFSTLALLTFPLLITACSNVAPTETGVTPPVTTTPPVSQIGQPDQTVAGYKDGTYTSIGDYRSPGGPEQVGVTVSLSHNIITDVQLKTMAIRGESKEKQDDFAANYRPYVIGKNIDDVKLSAIAGASLTPKGFNDALEKIKSEAK